jgi:predicted unusual protein kinase regulating ubiquinone biosynthesis (AarF/ABC1/UbiB family)
MDWMEGLHLSEFLATNPSQAVRDKIGQALWNFYMYQIHKLKRFHADPHPGNFLVDDQENLVAIDFGCIKEIPMDFYVPYFEVSAPETLKNPQKFKEKLTELEILKPTDNAKEITFFTDLFHELLTIFTQPVHAEFFDFSDATFYNSVANMSQKFTQDKTLRKMNGNRGSRHFIYVNRTFFGLYQLMFDIKAKIEVNQYVKF